MLHDIKVLEFLAFLVYVACWLYSIFLMKIINIIIMCLLFFATRINVGKNNRNLHKNNTVVFLPIFYMYMYLIGHNGKLSGFLNQNPYALYKVLIFHNYSCWAFFIFLCQMQLVIHIGLSFFALYTIKGDSCCKMQFIYTCTYWIINFSKDLFLMELWIFQRINENYNLTPIWNACSQYIYLEEVKLEVC